MEFRKTILNVGKVKQKHKEIKLEFEGFFLFYINFILRFAYNLIFPGSISTAEGSALVKLGNTTVVCGVKAVSSHSFSHNLILFLERLLRV